MVDLGLLKTDPDKLYPVIYYALKRTLKEWEEAMDERPGMSCTSVNPIYV
jgi:pre-mRNA-splicing factor 18